MKLLSNIIEIEITTSQQVKIPRKENGDDTYIEYIIGNVWRKGLLNLGLMVTREGR